jgi:hypothetical protein
MVTNSYLKKFLSKSLSTNLMLIFSVFFINAKAQSTPSAPSGLTKSVNPTYVVISWDSNPQDQNVSGYLTGTYISVMGDVATPTTGTSRTINYASIGLGPGDRFFLAVRAVNANGLSSISNIMVAVPWPADTQAPTAPVLNGGTPNVNNVTVSWGGSTDDVGVSSYNVYTYISASGGSPTYTSIGNSQTIDFSNLGLSAGQTFKVIVKAKDAAGNLSGASNEVSITVPTPLPDLDTEKPTASTLTNASPTLTEVVLNWSGSTDNVGVTGYNIYTYISASGGTPTYTSLGNSFNINFTNLGVTAGQTFKVIIKAKDAAGNLSGASNEVSITVPIPLPALDTEKPTSPTLTNMPPTSTSVVLNWSGSTDNVAVTGYIVQVYKIIEGDVPTYTNYFTTGTSIEIKYAELPLNAGQFFKVTVLAKDAADNYSSLSNEITINIPYPPTDTQLPTAPTLSNTIPTASDVVLNWSGSTDNVGVTGYNVYTYISSIGSLPTYTLIGNSQNINFAYLGLTAGQSFKVVVKAKDAAGNMSLASNEINLTVPNVVALKINNISHPKIAKINGQPIIISASITTPSANAILTYMWTIDGKDIFTQTDSTSYLATENSSSTVFGRLIIADVQLGKKDTMNFSFKSYKEIADVSTVAYSFCENGLGRGYFQQPNNFSVANFPHEKYFNFKVYDSNNKPINEVNVDPLNWTKSNLLYYPFVAGDTYFFELKRNFGDTNFIEFKKSFVAGDGTVNYNYSLIQPEVFGNPASFIILENAEKNVYAMYNSKISPYDILNQKQAKLDPGVYLFSVFNTKTNCILNQDIDVKAPPIASITTIKNYTWDNVTQNSIQIHYTIEKVNPNLTYSYQIFDGNTPLSNWKTLPSSTNGKVELSTSVENLQPSTTYNYKIKLRVDNYPNAPMVESTTLPLTTDVPIFTSQTDGLNLTVTLPKEIDINSTVTLRDISGLLVKSYKYTGTKTFSWNVADLTSGTYYITCYINVRPVTKQIMIIR